MSKIKFVSKTYRLRIFSDLITENKFGMPIVKRYQGEIPKRLQAFNKAVAQKKFDNTVHFYLNDKEFISKIIYFKK